MSRVTVSPVTEGSSRELTATLKDHTGAAIPADSVSTLTATIKDLATGEVINSRDEQNVKNANGGTLDATSGAFALILGPDDNAIESTAPAARYHRRRLLLHATYTDSNGNAGAENQEIDWSVEDLAWVT